MIVRAVWEFDVDVADLDENFVDILGLAKDLTKNELAHCLKNDELTADDFTYEILKGETK